MGDGPNDQVISGRPLGKAVGNGLFIPELIPNLGQRARKLFFETSLRLRPVSVVSAF